MIDVGWVVPLIAGAIAAAIAFVYYLKCREVARLRQVIDEWQGSRGWQAAQVPFGYRSIKWDAMCAEMKEAATDTTSDDDE